MKDFNSTIFDCALSTKRVQKWISEPNFENSRYIEQLNSFRDKLSDELKEELDYLMRCVKDYYEDAVIDNYSLMLNFGIKMGKELKETILMFDDLLLY